ncbi:MAG TPA: 30S ribosomal protein THX [Bacteroidales bacterium]|nr:30S ribosomal protein THX [Bacteroidales bacterium]
MGKGDKKTKRGKIVKGSYGVRRLRKKKTVTQAPKKIKKK